MQPRRHDQPPLKLRRSAEALAKAEATKKRTKKSKGMAAFALMAGWALVGQPDRGDIERGRQTFLRVGCYQCHGREAQGASTGPRLGPDPLPIAAFTRAVRTPRNEMPPYST